MWTEARMKHHAVAQACKRRARSPPSMPAKAKTSFDTSTELTAAPIIAAQRRQSTIEPPSSLGFLR
jgi:hypothetical protein